MNTVNRTFLFIFFAFVVTFQQLLPATLVYSMRIRRSFALDIPSAKKKKHFLVSAVPILYKRTRAINDIRLSLPVNIYEKNTIGGTLFNVRYVPSKKWWFEVTTGIEKETVVATGTSSFTVSRTGLDDIIFAGGHTKFLSKHAQFGMYAIGGIPAERKVQPLELYNTLVGTRFFSVGAGAEFSYSFINSLPRTVFVVGQVRGLHFFDRRWTPILPADATIQPGDVIDVLCAFNYREKRNIVEAGYSPTFFVHQAVKLPEQTVRGPNFVRHSVYATATHVFMKSYVLKKPLILGIGTNFSWAHRFNTRIVTCWLNATYVF